MYSVFKPKKLTQEVLQDLQVNSMIGQVLTVRLVMMKKVLLVDPQELKVLILLPFVIVVIIMPDLIMN